MSSESHHWFWFWVIFRFGFYFQMLFSLNLIWHFCLLSYWDDRTAKKSKLFCICSQSRSGVSGVARAMETPAEITAKRLVVFSGAEPGLNERTFKTAAIEKHSACPETIATTAAVCLNKRQGVTFLLAFSVHGVFVCSNFFYQLLCQRKVVIRISFHACSPCRQLLCRFKLDCSTKSRCSMNNIH